MSDLHLHLTIPGWTLWVLVGYLAVGAVTTPVLAVLIGHERGRTRTARQSLRAVRWYLWPLFIAVWPLSLDAWINDTQWAIRRRRAYAARLCEAAGPHQDAYGDHVDEGPCYFHRARAAGRPWWRC